MNDKILLMLQLQNQLNNATNGEEWAQKGVTKNGKSINWRRCIYMECAEMIDSFAWKHWKSIDQKADWDNLQIEVVDVWHFVMSLAIEEYAKAFRGGVEDIALVISELQALEVLMTNTQQDFASEDAVMEEVEELMRLSLAKQELNLLALFEHFFKLSSMSALDLEALYRLYVGKNILNQFRQEHGYKNGTYVKVWNGEEDNVVMKRIWEEHGDITPQELMDALTQAYNSAVGVDA